MRIVRSNSNRYQVRLVAVVLLALLGLIAAGCGGSSSSSMPKGGVAGASHATSLIAVKTRKLGNLGVVLVNKSGRTLYVFSKDARKRVTCKSSCASVWHALKWKGAGKPKVGGAAKSSLIGTVKSGGSRVVTYNKWPLYTYTGDSAAGQANGQAVTLNGGKWYVISAKGTVVKHSSGGGGGGTSTGGGGGGWG